MTCHVIGDPEMAELAQEEAAELESEIDGLQQKMKFMLLPKDPLDDRNIVLEVCLRVK